MKPIPWCTFRWFWARSAQLAIPQINPVHFTALALSVKHVAVGRIEQNIKTVSASELGPIGITNCFLALDTAGPDPIFVVLQSAGDAEVGFRIVERDAVKFSARKFIEMVPVFSTGKTLVKTTVSSE